MVSPMAIKFKAKSKEEIPAEAQSLYVKQDKLNARLKSLRSLCSPRLCVYLFASIFLPFTSSLPSFPSVQFFDPCSSVVGFRHPLSNFSQFFFNLSVNGHVLSTYTGEDKNKIRTIQNGYEKLPFLLVLFVSFSENSSSMKENHNYLRSEPIGTTRAFSSSVVSAAHEDFC